MRRLQTIPRILLATAVVAVLSAMAGGVLYFRRHPVTIEQREASSNVRAPAREVKPAVIRFVSNPEPAPAFEFHDISGRVFSAKDLQGKVVVLAFWATWCPPCREEIPSLISLQNQYKDRLQIIGISEDEDPPDKILRFAQQKGINYPIVMATPKLIKDYGGVAALPTAFIIDTQGRVVQKHVGLYPLDAYVRETRALLNLPVDAPVETFKDTGQVFLKNAANATELPGVSLEGLSADQKKTVLYRLNAESCTCGCGLTLAECRINDTECPVSRDVANKIVAEVMQTPASAAAAKTRDMKR